jgi:hypothetical protein
MWLDPPTLLNFGLVSFILEENSSKNIAGFIPVLGGYCRRDWFSGRFSHRKSEVLILDDNCFFKIQKDITWVSPCYLGKLQRDP